jgi:hypothetical protein
VLAGPIDSLELRIPKGHEHKFKMDFTNGRSLLKGRGSKYYEFVVKPTDLGLRAALHLKHRYNGNHKLQILNVGTMCWAEILQLVCQLYTDPHQLEIMRLDLAVDVPDYPVGWFRTHTRVFRKRTSGELGEYCRKSDRCETLYFGRRPNLVRIYDKLAQLGIKYADLRRSNDRIGVLTNGFDQIYGFPQSGHVLTRVERQFGGGRIPDRIRTLEKLRLNTPEFDPYSQLEFEYLELCDQYIDDLAGEDFLQAHGFMHLVTCHGRQEALRIINKKTFRNGTRMLDRLQRIKALVSDPQSPDLRGIFKDAIVKQLSDRGAAPAITNEVELTQC